MKLLVTDIEFDFEDSQGEIHPDDQYHTTYNALGIWEVDSEDELVDKITDTIGWCIKSIDYQPNAPHSLTSFL